MLTSETHHKAMLIAGLTFLKQTNSDYEKKLLVFSVDNCLKIIHKLGKDKVEEQFKLSDYQDDNFIHQLSWRIEFGVPVFLINNQMHAYAVASGKLLAVTTALNFCMAENMALTFNKMGLRNSRNACVYSNNALFQIVNRTMMRFEQMSLHDIKAFYDTI